MDLSDELVVVEMTRLARVRYGAEDPNDLPADVREALETEAEDFVEELLEQEVERDLESRLGRLRTYD